MPTVRVELTPEKLLEATEQLSSAELERFMKEVLALHARRKAPGLSKRETELMLKINSGLPLTMRERYHALIEKRRAETLTPAEYDELLALTNQSELKQAERLEALIELAQLRNISLPDLMKQLGIKPPPVG